MIKRLASVLLIPFFVLLFSPLSADAASRSFNITAKQWSFTPSTITVTEGDVVTLNVTSVDVSHGLAISQFGVNIRLSPGVTASATFTANKAGTYSFFCNVACGQGHGGMRGTLTVQAAPVVTNTNSSINTNTSTTTNTNTGTTNTTSVNTSQSATTNTSTTTTETSTPAVTDPVAEAEAVNELELSQDEPRTVNGSTNQSASTDVSTDINKKTTLPNANNQLNVAVADASTDEPNGSSSALGIGLIVVGVVVFGGVIFFGAKKKSNN